jgi:hypothetical protein
MQQIGRARYDRQAVLARLSDLCHGYADLIQPKAQQVDVGVGLARSGRQHRDVHGCDCQMDKHINGLAGLIDRHFRSGNGSGSSPGRPGSPSPSGSSPGSSLTARAIRLAAGKVRPVAGAIRLVAGQLRLTGRLRLAVAVLLIAWLAGIVLLGRRLAEVPETHRQIAQGVVDLTVDRIRGEASIRAALAGWQASQDGDALVEGS